jgi:hypothetical protein
MKREEKLAKVMKELGELLQTGIIESEVFPRGKLRARTGIKNHPIARYVHRMIEFETGINMCMPITTQFYLQNYVNHVLGKQRPNDDPLFCYLLRDGVEKLYNMLDEYSYQLIEKYSLN